MNRKTWIAFAIAPLWAPVCLVLLQVSRAKPNPNLDDLSMILDDLSMMQVVEMIALVGLAFGYLAMLIAGLPLHLFLKAQRLAGMLAYALSAFAAGVVLRCIGIVGSWLWFAIQEGLSLNIAGREFLDVVMERPTILLMPGALGALIGVTFWLIARPDRPSKATMQGI